VTWDSRLVGKLMIAMASKGHLRLITFRPLSALGYNHTSLFYTDTTSDAKEFRYEGDLVGGFDFYT